ncbi:MAG: RidA family protein [Zoogloeaceae bacterium]|jgi:enamine deaminase RidA (YjgF/YER057c/UK114 family)|nr:RidA family protein [Zoogloeaceae bacterium]
MSFRIFPFSVFLLASVLAANAQAADVIRHKIPNSDFPIAGAIEIPPGVTVVNLSGAVPSVSNVDAPKDSLEAYGDTETQTVSVLKNIEKNLKELGLTMGDVIKMQVFLVGDPATGGKLDFTGFMRGYTQFFGTKAGQINLPTRSVVQVAGLAGPHYLVEIEVTAVRKKK